MTGHAEEHMSPQRLAQVVVERLSAEESPVSGYWFEVRGDRDAYANELRAILGAEPVIVIVVRDIIFDNPNAVLAEFVALIDKHRDAFMQRFETMKVWPSHIGVVLLTRVVPAVPQVSSPARMPGWFPRIGGRTISVFLRDLTWTGSASIDCSESAVPEICARLFTLDGALLDRLTSVHAKGSSVTNALWTHIQLDDANAVGDYLQAARRFRATVHNESAFRPDARNGTTVVARIWKVVQNTAPEKVGRVGEALASALALPEPLNRNWYQAFASVLARPANRPTAARTAFATSLLRTVAASAQFITVAAHADAYSAYPILLLRSVSLDLRRGLADATSLLIDLESP